MTTLNKKRKKDTKVFTKKDTENKMI